MSEEAMKNNAEQSENLEGVSQSEGDSGVEKLTPEQAASIMAEENKQIAPEQAKIDELNDKLLRAMAEAQNTKRRAEIDVQNARNFSTQNFAKDLLSVMDNLSRACENISDEKAEQDPQYKAIKEGVEITKREMVKIFERNNIKAVDPTGKAFDPNLHQAMSQIVDPNVAAGNVVQVMQVGYTLKDRLLRPAMVVVSKAPENKEA